MKKTVVILANSVRRGGHCIAGREVTKLEDDQWHWGTWIRPVSQHGEGEVSNSECTCSDRTTPAPLDLLEIGLLEKQNYLFQPENYFIDTSVPWHKITKVTSNSLLAVEEKPQNLWLQMDTSNDRLHSSKIGNLRKPFQSLYLIRPVHLRFLIWEAMDRATCCPRKYRKAIFTYENVEYDLAITDPTMDSRYFFPFPELNKRPREIMPKAQTNCLLVVSLAAPFTDGFHYKVVATVLEY